MGWKEKKRTLFKRDRANSIFPADVFHNIERGIALELIEKLFERIVMKIGSLIGAADNGNDEIGVSPDLLVADRRLE